MPDLNSYADALLGGAQTVGTSAGALANGLLQPFQAQPYANPQFLSPDQLRSRRAYAQQLLNPMQVHRPAEGFANLARALIGGNMDYQADMAESSGRAAAASDYTSAVTQAQTTGGAPSTAAPAGATGTPDGSATPPSGPVADYIAAGAKARGIDPPTAVKVLAGESNLDPMAAGDPNSAGKKSSFGVAQLHYGNPGGGGPNDGPGLGDEFTAKTGLDARDPTNWPATVDFALDKAAKGGWAPWHAAQKVGVGAMDGIGGNPASSPSPAGGTPRIDPQLAGRILSNPYSTPEEKAYVTGIMTPPVTRDGYGNSYYLPPGGPARPVPGMGPGVLPGNIGAGGANTSTYTVRDPNTGEIKVYSAAGGGTNGDGGLRKLGDTGGDIAANNASKMGDTEGDLRIVNSAKANAYAAQSSLAGLQTAAQAAQAAGYGIIPNLQAIAGNYGIDTTGLSPIQAFQKVAGAVAASDPILGPRLAAALPTMTDSKESRQLVMDNLLKITQRQAEMGKIATDSTLSTHDRASKLIDYPLPGAGGPPAAPQPASAGAAGGGSPTKYAGRFSSNDDALSQARAAIAAGKPRAAVIARLREVGVDPSGL